MFTTVLFIIARKEKKRKRKKNENKYINDKVEILIEGLLLSVPVQAPDKPDSIL